MSLNEESGVVTSCKLQARVHCTQWPYPRGSGSRWRDWGGEWVEEYRGAAAEYLQGKGQVTGRWLCWARTVVVLALTLITSLWAGTEDILCSGSSGPGGPQSYDPVPEVIVFLRRCCFFGLHLATSYTSSQS